MKIPKTPEELERQIIEHPVKMYFRLRIGLLEKIKKNGEDMMDALKMTAESCLFLALFIAVAICHITMMVFYPIAKLTRFRRLRKEIMQNPGRVRFVNRRR